MYKGKSTCKILKEIRRQIAESNDIEFVTSECQYQGDCSGTCPKCEAELRYLEAELNRRRQLGKAITMAGLSLGLSSALVGCHSATTEDELPVSSESSSKTTEQIVSCTDSMPSTRTHKASQDSEIVIPARGDFDIDYDLYPGVVDIPEETTPADLSDVLDFVEEPPEFPGGPEAMMDFLQNEIQYPDIAKSYGITGIVLIKFVVEQDGSLSNPKVIVPLFPVCDEEAIRGIMMMPPWEPGKNKGEPVRCFYSVPVSFKID